MSSKSAVLTAIIHYKLKNDGNTPTVRWLADKCGIASTSIVQRFIQELVDDGKLRRGEGKRDLKVVGGRWSLGGAAPPPSAKPMSRQQPVLRPKPKLSPTAKEYHLAGLVDVPFVARRLNIHEESVRRLIRNGELSAVKVGNKWFITRASLDEFAEDYWPKPGNKPKSHELESWDAKPQRGH